jgi:DNA-directed RNA polymerase omega subunit
LDGHESIDSKFRLCILAAKRAKQIVNGSKRKIEIKAENPLSVAIEEINQGKINFHLLDSEEPEYTQDDLFDELDELSELSDDEFEEDEMDDDDMDDEDLDEDDEDVLGNTDDSEDKEKENEDDENEDED